MRLEVNILKVTGNGWVQLDAFDASLLEAHVGKRAEVTILSVELCQVCHDDPKMTPSCPACGREARPTRTPAPPIPASALAPGSAQAHRVALTTVAALRNELAAERAKITALRADYETCCATLRKTDEDLVRLKRMMNGAEAFPTDGPKPYASMEIDVGSVYGEGVVQLPREAAAVFRPLTGKRVRIHVWELGPTGKRRDPREEAALAIDGSPDDEDAAAKGDTPNAESPNTPTPEQLADNIASYWECRRWNDPAAMLREIISEAVREDRRMHAIYAKRAAAGHAGTGGAANG